jgi:putative hemolysin
MKLFYKQRFVRILAAGMTSFGLVSFDISAAQERVGLANPSAVFCLERGGEYLLDTGQCRLPDGTTMDAWAYFRTQYASGAELANPAAVFCQENGSYNLNAGTCTLGDGRVVDAWEYFRSQHAD